MESFKEAAKEKYQKPVRTVSAVSKSGSILELVYDPGQQQTSFAVWKNE